MLVDFLGRYLLALFVEHLDLTALNIIQPFIILVFETRINMLCIDNLMLSMVRLVLLFDIATELLLHKAVLVRVRHIACDHELLALLGILEATLLISISVVVSSLLKALNLEVLSLLSHLLEVVSRILLCAAENIT